QELRRVLDQEIGELPARFRAVVVLCYLEGKSVDEAARLLGCPPGTVASRLARARFPGSGPLSDSRAIRRRAAGSEALIKYTGLTSTAQANENLLPAAGGGPKCCLNGHVRAIFDGMVFVRRNRHVPKKCRRNALTFGVTKACQSWCRAFTRHRHFSDGSNRYSANLVKLRTRRCKLMHVSTTFRS